MSTLKKPIADRFWPKVQKSDGCWLWTGAVCPKQGYGRFGIGGINRKTHRVVWELTRGPIPPGMWVLHRCDVTACVNPDHLFLGTRTDNVIDMVLKGRARGAGGRPLKPCPHRDDPDRFYIQPSTGDRRCRRCNRERSRIHSAKRRAAMRAARGA